MWETDDDGHVIDLVKDKLPEMQLSEEDRQKNLELLEEAKKVSDRFLTRRGRRSTCSLTESPTGNTNNHTQLASQMPALNSVIRLHVQCAWMICVGQTTQGLEMEDNNQR